MVSYLRLAQFSHLTFEECHSNFVACLVFLGVAFSFIKLISSSDTLTKREAASLKISYIKDRNPAQRSWSFAKLKIIILTLYRNS